MDDTQLNYIAKRYAEDLIRDAIEDAAQDRVYECISYQADDDDLTLSNEDIKILQAKVYNLMSNADIKINEQEK